MRNTVQCTQYFIPHSLQGYQISLVCLKKIKNVGDIFSVVLSLSVFTVET